MLSHQALGLISRAMLAQAWIAHHISYGYIGYREEKWTWDDLNKKGELFESSWGLL